MTKCYQTSLEFPLVKRRKVEADFTGGDITSNGGIGLLAQVDQKMGLTRALKNTALAKASPNRIRLTPLKIGAVVMRNTRRVRILMSSACPHQDLFRTVALRLNSS